MTDKKIIVDIDEVTLCYVSALIKYLNEKCKKNFRKRQIKSWDLNKYYPISNEELSRVWVEFTKRDEFSNLRLVNNAKQGIQELSKYGKIYFVTYRKKETKEKTEKNLENKLPAVWQDVIFSDKQDKDKIFKKLNPRLIIDDSADQIQHAMNLGFDFLLFNCPWNKELDVGDKRVYSWKEIIARKAEYL